MTKTRKYQSPSTPSVSHDLPNFIVEAILINRYGMLPEYSWRKGMPFAQEWGRLLTCIRRISKTLGVDHKQLAWFVQFYKITDLNYKDFGLLRWKIQRYFKWCNIDKFTTYYCTLHTQRRGKENAYAENAVGYKTKEAAPRQRTLSDILKELESEADGKEGTEDRGQGTASGAQAIPE